MRVIIQPATHGDLPAVASLQGEVLQGLPSPHGIAARSRQWLATEWQHGLSEHLADQCLLVARAGRRVVGSVCLDLELGALANLCVAPGWRRGGIGRRLVIAAERRATGFGMNRLTCEAPRAALPFFTACRYQQRRHAAGALGQLTGIETVTLERDIARRLTRYGRRIRALLDELGIPRDYGRSHRLMLTPECRELATIGVDVARREALLRPEAALAWYGLRDAATMAGVELQVVSAYRSVDYQAGIVRNKLAAGQPLSRVLEVSAAPGFSEHHTGRALDLSCPGCPPLEGAFEHTRAFEWLLEHAGAHGFRLSYPRNNRHGIAFEPWHWAWTG